MRLVILRHAIAEEEHPDHPGDDFCRRLTPEGRLKLRKVLRRDVACQPPPQSIYTSPLVRARQTARLASRWLDLPAQVADPLAPTEDSFSWIQQVSDSHVLVVGHEPGLSWLAARFLGLDRPLFGIKKAGMVALQGEPGRGQLLWAMTPRWLV